VFQTFLSWTTFFSMLLYANLCHSLSLYFTMHNCLSPPPPPLHLPLTYHYRHTPTLLTHTHTRPCPPQTAPFVGINSCLTNPQQGGLAAMPWGSTLPHTLHLLHLHAGDVRAIREHWDVAVGWLGLLKASRSPDGASSQVKST
jgi:hypothetical protein